VVLFALVVCLSAQSPPVISDDFTANVTMIEEHPTHRTHLRGILYEDYTNRRQRIDTQHNFEHPVHYSFFRFYQLHTEYEYQLENNKCIKRALNATMRPAFDWVQSGSHLEPRECHGQGSLGSLWGKTTDHDFAELCDGKSNPNTSPYWMALRTSKHTGREITFHTFTAGTPDPNKFVLPSICS